jgi:threonine dehydrogenase-like Zn-dependent dehydrogenase
MKAALFKGIKNIQAGEVERPALQNPTDAIVRVVRACVCGSDLWFYRGIEPKEHGSQCGHEGIGVVEQVGGAVTDFAPGDFVIIPFGLGCAAVLDTILTARRSNFTAQAKPNTHESTTQTAHCTKSPLATTTKISYSHSSRSAMSWVQAITPLS